jgi:hypothetical protein
MALKRAVLLFGLLLAGPLPSASATESSLAVEAEVATEAPQQPAAARSRRHQTTRESLEGRPQAPIVLETPTRLAGIAEVSLGWLTLPRAVVCGPADANCERGDTTPAVEIWNLVRIPAGFAFGAGLTLGLIPTTDVPTDNPPGVDRTHKRAYMTIEGMIRYYPFKEKRFEGWVGAGPGIVIVSDTFASRLGLDENAYVGNPGVTLRTEGLSALAALGFSFALTDHWYLGGGARGGVWHVPEEPAVSPFGDEASLKGSNYVLSAGLSVAFRTKL